ncbi:MAG: DMT family transporter [Pseudomonadota bacterium]
MSPHITLPAALTSRIQNLAPETRGVLGMAVATFFFIAMDSFAKGLGEHLPPMMVVWARYLSQTLLLMLLFAPSLRRRLVTTAPGLQLLRGALLFTVTALFFSALAVLPLAEAIALVQVGPLFITALAALILAEKVGPRRWIAVAVGFIGVLVMMRPWEGFGTAGSEGINRWFLLLPLGSAVAYAGMQILTRRLGVHAPAAAMAIYIQSTFLCVSILFGIIAGDGRYLEGIENESLRFLLRPWIIPEQDDLALIGGLGLAAGFIGYTLSQAYRSAPAATVAPFEYVLVPLSLFWGFAIFGELPSTAALVGSALITSAGLYVFMREGQRGRTLATARPTRRP